MKKGNKGFTLIELLVVIAIIAILSTVVMAGLNSARMKGRDAKRLSDVKQMQAAFELFFDSCGGYPSALQSTANQSASGASCGSSVTLGSYLATIPTPPTPQATPTGYTYAPVSSGASYTLVFGLEGPSGSLVTAGTHTASPTGIL